MLITGGILFAGAGGLVENSLRELTSRLAGPQRQGLVAGAGGSLSALAMVLGPLGGGLLYSQFGPATAYWLGGCVVLLGIGAVALVAPYVRKTS
jgi:MFS family permease